MESDQLLRQSEDLPGLLVRTLLLVTLSLQVALLQLLQQEVSPTATVQEDVGLGPVYEHAAFTGTRSGVSDRVSDANGVTNEVIIGVTNGIVNDKGVSDRVVNGAVPWLVMALLTVTGSVLVS